MYAVVPRHLLRVALTRPDVCTLDADGVTAELADLPLALDHYTVIEAREDGQVVPVYTAHEWVREMT
jgi:hypothetical protein